MNKAELEEKLSLKNSNIDDSRYSELMRTITDLVKENEGHCDERHVNDVYFDYVKKHFDVELFITEDEDAENGVWNDNEPETIYYSLDEVLVLINK